MSGDFEVIATEMFPHHMSVIQESESRTSISDVGCLNGAVMTGWSQTGMKNPDLWHFICFRYVVVTLGFLCISRIAVLNTSASIYLVKVTALLKTRN